MGVINLKNIFSVKHLFFAMFLISATQGVAEAADSPTPPAMPIQFEHHGFKFSPGRSCENGWIDQSFCEATSPKQWNEAEFGAIKRWLSALPSPFLNRVQKNKFNVIYRYGHGFLKGPDGKYVRDEPIAWVWGVDHSINISDFVFFAGAPSDPVSGYDVKHKTFVHELGHAFDAGSIGSDFTSLVGWEQVRGEWVLKNIDMAEVRTTYAEVKRLGWEGLAQGDPRKVIAALRLNREYGMKHGFPTAYSMTNPSECFAEITAHLFVDPIVERYLRPQVVTWFRENVIPEYVVIADLRIYDNHVARLRKDFSEIPEDPTNKEWVTKKLAHMFEVDQYMRQFIDTVHAHKYSEAQTQYFWSQFGPRFESVDRANTKSLKDLLKIYRWFTISQFGAVADQNAWLIVQHADKDVKFQKDVLAILTGLYPKHETSRRNFAYLYDRVATNEKRPQSYGTQGRCVAPEIWEPNEIEEREQVDSRRADMELEPLAEYIARFRDICK